MKKVVDILKKISIGIFTLFIIDVTKETINVRKERIRKRKKIMNANNFLFVAESLLNAIVFLLVFAPVVILWLEEELLVNKKRKKDKKKHHKKRPSSNTARAFCFVYFCKDR